MLHSTLHGIEWPYERLATTEDELRILVRLYQQAGFTFVKACDLFSARGNVVSLTFDDGYLDNWTRVFAMLAPMRIPFTVFINKDFVVMDDVVRPLGQKQPGYLSAGELRRMHESGFVDIQSHSVSHTWYPISPKVATIFGVNDKPNYPWLYWNVHKEMKPYWIMASFSEFIGQPVFENDRSLRARRFLFDHDALDAFVRHVQTAKLPVEAANRLWNAEYYWGGRPETIEEQKERYRREIEDNARFIEDLLGLWPSVLCWPGGAHNEHSREIAYNYHACSTIRQGYCRDPKCMHRISPGNPSGRHRFPWKFYRATLAYYTIRQLAGGVFRS